jgi:hypothetical protein
MVCNLFPIYSIILTSITQITSNLAAVHERHWLYMKKKRSLQNEGRSGGFAGEREAVHVIQDAGLMIDLF